MMMMAVVVDVNVIKMDHKSCFHFLLFSSVVTFLITIVVAINIIGIVIESSRLIVQNLLHL